MGNEIALYSPAELGRFTLPTTISILIVDRSISMTRFGNTPCTAVNAHIEALKKCDDGRAYFCAVITFCRNARVEIRLRSVHDIIEPLAYQNEGGTLLWETVDRVMKQLFGKLLGYPPGQIRVVLGVFTDGEDRQSDPEIYPALLKETSKHAIAKGWELMSYGFGINAKDVAEDMGFPTDDDHVFTAEATEVGVEEAVRDMTETSTIGGGRAWRIKTKV